jgi:hypothetical protein
LTRLEMMGRYRMDVTEPNPVTPTVRRRTVIAGGVGLSALALPSAAVAASVAPSGGGATTTFPATESPLFHLDADSYSPGLGVGWNDLSGKSNHGTIGSGVTYVAAAGACPPISVSTGSMPTVS